MDLAKLVALAQGAKEGSEYLDYAIQRLFGTAKPVPLYSRSLDDALRVMPEGWTINRLSHLSDCQGGFGGWVCEAYRAHDAMIPYPASGTAATAPLAICLAALRVRFGEALTKDKEEAERIELSGPLQRSGTNR